MRVKIKLRDQGIKHKPKVWLIVQPSKQNLKGKYLEHIGVWQPRVGKTFKRHIAINTHRANYWLSVGAIPTRGAHRVLSRFGMLPKLPAPYGSAQAYERPEKVYKQTHFRGWSNRQFSANKVAFHYKKLLQEEMNLIERKRRLNQEAMDNAGGPQAQAESAIDTDAEDTDNIDSEEVDIFERTKKFELVLKKFNKHREQNLITLRGNDLRYNVYLKKLNKMTRKDLGLDIHAYRDYVNNLKEFAHINKDLNVFAAEALLIGADVQEKGVLSVGTTYSPSQPEIQKHLEGQARVDANAQSIKFSLAKFLRTNSGFVTQRDHEAVKELRENLELYMLNDSHLFDQMHRVYRRRKRELNEQTKQALMIEELMKDVSRETLSEAKVSQIEYQQIQLLLKFDKDMFARESKMHPHNFLQEDNPYTFFVDFSRLPAVIPQKVKQLLYRPERMARLAQAYQRLAAGLKNDWQRRVNEKFEWERNKHKRLDWHDRQTPKSKEELALIDSLVRQIDANLHIQTEEGMREIDDRLSDVNAPIETFTDVRDWYKPLLTKLIEERRKIPKAERLKMFRNDSVDEVDTTDLEDLVYRGLDITDSGRWPNGKVPEEELTTQMKFEAKLLAEKEFQQRVLEELNYETEQEDFGSSSDDEEGSSSSSSSSQSESEDDLDIDDVRNMLAPADKKVRAREMKTEWDKSAAKERLFLMMTGQIGEDLLSETHLRGLLQEETDKKGPRPKQQADEDDGGADRGGLLTNRPKKAPINYPSAEAFPGLYRNEADKYYFEGDLRREEKRFNLRHRIDFAKLYFSKDGGYTLREFKKWHKTELEENPERYSYLTKSDKKRRQVEKQELERIRKRGERSDDPEIRVNSQRIEMLSTLKKGLDKLIPHLKSKAAEEELTLDDSLADNEAFDREGLLDLAIQTSPEYDREPVDEKSSRQAAILQNMLDPAQQEERPLLSPEHLRYIVRQLKLFKIIREHKLVGLKDVLDKENQGASLEIIDLEHSDEGGSAKNGKLEYAEIVDQMLGEKLLKTIEAGKNFNVSELTRPDFEVFAEYAHLNAVSLTNEINRLEKEADELDVKLSTLTIRERAEWDQAYPFSINEFDSKELTLLSLYEKAQRFNAIAEKEENKGKVEKLEIDPLHEEWFKQRAEKENNLLKKYAAEIKGEPAFANLDQERIEKVLEEVVTKDGLKTGDEAVAFFEEQWRKLMEANKVHRVHKTPGPEFVDPKGESEQQKWDKLVNKDSDYHSVHPEEFVLDAPNAKKRSKYIHERIGRYPMGFRHFENFANYSQEKKDATIQDYIEEMYRPCEFADFLTIQRQKMSEEVRTPEVKHMLRRDTLHQLFRSFRIQDKDKPRLYQLDDSELDDLIQPDGVFNKLEVFLKSKIFVDECRKIYSAKVQSALLKKKQFTFLEALEATMDLVTIDKNLFTVPLANTYIPVRNTIMKKPNLLDQDFESDELGYRYNDYSKGDTTRKRFHPLEQLNPLRGNRMGPTFSGYDSMYKERNGSIAKPRTFFKWRRLSKVQDKNFSTLARPLGSGLVSSTDAGVSLPSRLLFIPTLATAFNPFRQ